MQFKKVTILLILPQVITLNISAMDLQKREITHIDPYSKTLSTTSKLIQICNHKIYEPDNQPAHLLLINELKQLLSTNTINLEELDEENNTALIMATRICDIKIIKLLLEAGANPNKANIFGETALMWISNIIFSENTTQEIISQLAKYNANPNLKNNKGQTALMIAAKRCNLSAINQLLENFKLNINEQDDEGNTALYYALVSYYHIDTNIIKKLIYAGANVNLRNNKGISPLHYAKTNYLSKITELMQTSKCVII